MTQPRWETGLDRLAELRATLEAGSAEESAILRLEMLSMRVLDVGARPDRVTRGDLDLLYGLGADLRTLGRHQEALDAYELAEVLAAVQADGYAVALLRLQQTHCLIGLLDFPGAGERLAGVLELPATSLDTDVSRCLSRAAVLRAGDTRGGESPADRHALRA